MDLLLKYIEPREYNPEIKDATGCPMIYVNKSIVKLGTGLGFGELALISSTPRMASIRASMDC